MSAWLFGHFDMELEQESGKNGRGGLVGHRNDTPSAKGENIWHLQVLGKLSLGKARKLGRQCKADLSAKSPEHSPHAG